MSLQVNLLANPRDIGLVTNKTKGTWKVPIFNTKGQRIRHHGSGYVQIYQPEHPKADHDGFVYEHRLVYEQSFGCCLLEWTNVHHKNGNKSDNHITNLQAMTISRHTTKHRTGVPRSEETKRKLSLHHNPNSNLVGRGPYKYKNKVI